MGLFDFAGANITENEVIQKVSNRVDTNMDSACKTDSLSTNVIDCAGDFRMSGSSKVRQEITVTSDCILSSFADLVSEQIATQKNNVAGGGGSGGDGWVASSSLMQLTKSKSDTDVKSDVKTAISSSCEDVLTSSNIIKSGGNCIFEEDSELTQTLNSIAKCMLDNNLIQVVKQESVLENILTMLKANWEITAVILVIVVGIVFVALGVGAYRKKKAANAAAAKGSSTGAQKFEYNGS